jgi:hypothetical protein
MGLKGDFRYRVVDVFTERPLEGNARRPAVLLDRWLSS